MVGHCGGVQQSRRWLGNLGLRRIGYDAVDECHVLKAVNMILVAYGNLSGANEARHMYLFVSPLDTGVSCLRRPYAEFPDCFRAEGRLHDTELALMLFDPTRGKGELDDVREWNARLEAQRRGRTTTKLLVGSKLDDGDGDGAVDRTAVVRCSCPPAPGRASVFPGCARRWPGASTGRAWPRPGALPCSSGCGTRSSVFAAKAR